MVAWAPLLISPLGGISSPNTAVLYSTFLTNLFPNQNHSEERRIDKCLETLILLPSPLIILIPRDTTTLLIPTFLTATTTPSTPPTILATIVVTLQILPSPMTGPRS